MSVKVKNVSIHFIATVSDSLLKIIKSISLRQAMEVTATAAAAVERKKK
jgi:hypothetical protein